MKNMANQFLALSLFIMLLAFFIILNAISSYEVSKTAPVLNSLSLTFASKQTEDPDAPGNIDERIQSTNAGSTLDKMESLFKSQITGVKTKQNRLGTMMIVRMPFKDFERSIAASLTIPGQQQEKPQVLEAPPTDLLPVLVSLMETQRAVTYKMDMLLNVDGKPSQVLTNEPERFAALNKSITKVALRLEEAGLPKIQMSAGLERGQEGMVELFFRRYEPFNPLGENAPLKDEGAP